MEPFWALAGRTPSRYRPKRFGCRKRAEVSRLNCGLAVRWTDVTRWSPPTAPDQDPRTVTARDGPPTPQFTEPQPASPARQHLTQSPRPPSAVAPNEGVLGLPRAKASTSVLAAN